MRSWTPGRSTCEAGDPGSGQSLDVGDSSGYDTLTCVSRPSGSDGHGGGERQRGGPLVGKADQAPPSQPTISHHLKILNEAGLVSGERRTKWVWYSLNRDRLASLRAAIDA